MLVTEDNYRLLHRNWKFSYSIESADSKILAIFTVLKVSKTILRYSEQCFINVY